MLAQKDTLFPNDELCIQCQIDHPDGHSSLGNDTTTDVSVDLSLAARDDFRALLDSKDRSDATFVVDSKEFPVHKAIVCARSAVFEAMFTHDLKEKATGRVDIEDIDAETFQALLEFVYTGVVSDLTGLADRLLPAAKKYRLDGLSQACSSCLVKELTVDGAANTLVLGDLLCPDLKKSTIDFITNKVADVVVTPAWKKLANTNKTLTIEVLTAAVLRTPGGS